MDVIAGIVPTKAKLAWLTALLVYGRPTYYRVFRQPRRSLDSPSSPRLVKLCNSSWRSPGIGVMYLLNSLTLMLSNRVMIPNYFIVFNLLTSGVLPFSLLSGTLPDAFYIISKKAFSVIPRCLKINDLRFLLTKR